MPLSAASYGAAALLYGAAALLALLRERTGPRWSPIVLALLASAVWGVGSAVLHAVGSAPLAAPVALDALRLLAWTACAVSWLDATRAKRWLVGVSVGASAWALGAAGVVWWVPELGGSVRVALLIVALLGLLTVEQVFRNARTDQRRRQRLLCLAVGGIFAIDIFVYSEAILLEQETSSAVRAVANVALSPLILIGAANLLGSKRELFVSRHVVFYMASLVGVGAYLVVMGVAAYVLRAFGSDWGIVPQLLFLAAAGAVLIAVLFSTNIRMRLRVFLVKHFYRHKYDYRDEWLRLTSTLGQAGDLKVACGNALAGLARIAASPRGCLWLDRDGQRYEWIASLDDEPPPVAHYDKSHPLVAFLASLKWVIDSDEYRQEPDRYGTYFGDPRAGVLPPHAIVVPLDCLGHLIGFVVLERPAEWRPMNFEDHDILKTAGRQVAVVLAQALDHERLSEARQFEAMSRLTAFLMHDLKNIVAQQELVVANAQRFRQRPEFLDDAFATIRSGVERMKKVLDQLSARGAERSTGRVDVAKLLNEVRSQCADREPVPEVDIKAQPAWVNLDRDRLINALTHLVRNAQDATPPGGRIVVAAHEDNGEVVVTVTDTGCGMSAEFLRERLFRPFDSTKGAKGMGIGAYQVRHLVRLAGGDVEVTSEPGRGTVVRLKLPTVELAAKV